MPNKLISLHFKFCYFQSKTTKTSIFQSCNIHTHRSKYNSKTKKKCFGSKAYLPLKYKNNYLCNLICGNTKNVINFHKNIK